MRGMLALARCSELTGGEDCPDMAEFAEAKLDFLRGFLELKHGAPSHDTFSRLFRLLDPEQFRTCFQRFMARFAAAAQGVMAIDDKVLRRSFDTASGQSPLHRLWCKNRMTDVERRLSLAFRRCAETLAYQAGSSG